MSAIIQHPRAVELVERRKLRKKVERAVSRLIDILDELDTDPDAEPWLGAPELPANCGGYVYFGRVVPPIPWARGANDDREEEDEHGGDILDGGDDDRVDNEPSLAATEDVDQTRWGQGDTSDRELDPLDDEFGPGDCLIPGSTVRMIEDVR